MLGGRKRRSVFVEGWGSGGGKVGEMNSHYYVTLDDSFSKHKTTKASCAFSYST